MKFESSPAGSGPLGLAAAALRGVPGPGGCYFPVGEADLRPALYAPTSTFAEFASAALMALFPGELDPFLADRLAAAAFENSPPSFAYGDEILALDLATGPSGSSADYGAAFLAALLAAAPRGDCPRVVLAAAPPAGADGAVAADGAALAEAVSGQSGADPLYLVLLRPRGSSLRGIKPFRLARKGGRSLVFDVEGSLDEVDALIGAAAGGELCGCQVTAGGPSNPARLAARLVLHAAAFSLASRGSSGDLFHALAPDDGIGLAAALWCWRSGLPESGIVLAEAAGRSLGPSRGRGQVDRFAVGNPGALRALVRGEAVSEADAKASLAALVAAGGPELDLASALSLAAAERALAGGLRGHARLVVHREALPSWDAVTVPAGGLSEAPADASIQPEPRALESALGRLLRDYGLEPGTRKD